MMTCKSSQPTIRKYTLHTNSLVMMIKCEAEGDTLGNLACHTHALRKYM